MKARCMLYLDEEVIKNLKFSAILRKTSMSRIVEDLISEHLNPNNKNMDKI